LRIAIGTILILFLVTVSLGTALATPVAAKPEATISAQKVVATASTAPLPVQSMVRPNTDIEKLPCMSIGAASRGRLINGKHLPSNKGWITRSPYRQHATPELISELKRAINVVRKRHPDSCRLVTGDISFPRGGPMLPHRSHQAGRDIDIGMFAKNNRQMTHFEIMTADNLDLAKTWTLIAALLEGGQIEYIMVDYSIQALLYDYVKNRLRASDSYLEPIFQYPKGRTERTGIIRHYGGHRNHLHVRFFCPKAVTAARKYNHLLTPGIAALNNPENLPPSNAVAYIPRMRGLLPKIPDVGYLMPSAYPLERIAVFYTASEGDTLGSVANKYEIGMNELCTLNGFSKNTVIYPGMSIKVIAPSTVVDSYKASAGLVTSSELLAKYGTNRSVYKVQPGDTIWTIAQDQNVRAADICQWNDLTFKTDIQPGSEILLYKSQPIYALAGTFSVPSSMFYKGGLEIPLSFSQRIASLWEGMTWATVKNFIRLVI